MFIISRPLYNSKWKVLSFSIVLLLTLLVSFLYSLSLPLSFLLSSIHSHLRIFSSLAVPHFLICNLYLTFYPDFTIMHPKTGKLLYWEHFGLMDAPEYRDKAFRKLRIYADHGILPGINLITTYETRSHPLTYAEIDHQIQHLLDD